jgi:hypothetical protein
MGDLKTKVPTDQWIATTWDEYVELTADPAYQKAKSYYHKGQLRIEMGTGSAHSRDQVGSREDVTIFSLPFGTVLATFIAHGYSGVLLSFEGFPFFRIA